MPARASRDMGVDANVLPKSMPKMEPDSVQTCPGLGPMKPEPPEINRLRKAVAKLKVRHEVARRWKRFAITLHRSAI